MRPASQRSAFLRSSQHPGVVAPVAKAGASCECRRYVQTSYPPRKTGPAWRLALSLLRLGFEGIDAAALGCHEPGGIMETNWQVDAPPRPSMPGAVPARGRIAIPLDRVLDFARHDSDSRSSRPLAFALRPLLTLALATTGLFRGLRQSPPAPPHKPAGGE